MVAFRTEFPVSPDCRSYLAVRAGDACCVILIGYVGAIGKFAVPTLVPEWPRFCIGGLRITGMVTPVLDLRQILGVSSAPRPDACVVAVYAQSGAGRIFQLGLIVDALPRIIEVPTNAIVSMSHGGPLVGQVALDRGKNAMVIDVDRLLTEADFQRLLEVAPVRGDAGAASS